MVQAVTGTANTQKEYGSEQVPIEVARRHTAKAGCRGAKNGRLFLIALSLTVAGLSLLEWRSEPDAMRLAGELFQFARTNSLVERLRANPAKLAAASGGAEIRGRARCLE
jgi:hypothetical protein